MERTVARSKALFDSSGLYCAESVLLALAEYQGIESELIPKIATGLCAGISGSSGMCGALLGGIMGLNLTFGRSEGSEPVDDCFDAVGSLIDGFRRQFGSRNCTELLGCDIGTDEGLARAEQENLFANCIEFVGEATRLSVALIEGASV